MSTIELFLTKYNTESIYMATFEEMNKDFQVLEPTKIPIIDISIINTIGKYIYEFTNYQKWIICPNLKDELINMIINLSNKTKKINVYDLNLIFEKYKNNKNSPDSYSIKNELFEFVDEIIKKQLLIFPLNEEQSLKEYMDFRMNFQKEYKFIISNYTIYFNEIDIKVENIMEILMNKFEKLEELPEYEDTINIIENINTRVSIKMDKLISFTNDLLKKAKEQSSSLVGYNGVMLFEKLKKNIMISFNKEMDLYYDNEIKALKFDDSINDVLLQLYNVEKAMFRFSLRLGEIEFAIEN
jgi:hypothetical protein